MTRGPAATVKDEVVAINLTFVLPRPADGLRFSRNSAEVLSQFEQRLTNQLLGHRLAVIKPQRQEEFESSERSAHKWAARPP